jgi:hypothetical protein
MSIHNLGGLSVVKLVVPIAALAAMLAVISCADLDGNDDVDERFYGFFQRDAKVMQDMGLPVYWLGREFTAGGLTYRGPYAPEFGGDVEDGRLWMGYEPTSGTTFEITVYSPAAWQSAKDWVLNPQTLTTEGKVTRRTVTVKGRQAELISVPSGTRPVGKVRLVIDLNEVVVLAVARALGPVSPGGPDRTVFINNPDLLVQVIDDNLRPYPE